MIKEKEKETSNKAVRTWSSLVTQWAEDPVLSLLCHGFEPWPQNLWVQPKNKIYIFLSGKGLSSVAQWITNPNRTHGDAGLIPGLTQ